MKHYFQEGYSLKRQPLQASGNICDCCDGLLHAAEGERETLEDDIECPKCGKLCACACHRESPNLQPQPDSLDPDEL